MRVSTENLFILVLLYSTVTALKHSGTVESKAITKNQVIRYASSTKNENDKETKGRALSSPKNKSKITDPEQNSKITPKHLIERSIQHNNPFGHLSELLGIKGSFIPSQTHQTWLGDEGLKGEEVPDVEASAEKRPIKDYENNDMSSMREALPVDINPEQANIIASSADTNKQRQKFLNWEHKSGSLDMQHYPSKYLQDEKDSGVADGEIAEAVENAQVVSRKPANVKADDINGPAFSRMKADSSLPKFYNIEPNKNIHNLESSNKGEGIAAKKGYMENMVDQFNPRNEDLHFGRPFSAVNNYAGNKVASQGVQPLTHAMINNLQMDPAWDAVEAKMLEQHGHSVTPMRLPVSKIDREMMPPEGEPVGQPYLPLDHQRLHHQLINDFHKTAGFPSQEVQPDLKPEPYYSHYEAHNGPHQINMGGVIVQAIGDPWKHLKQTNYDEADDNFPVATSNGLMQPSTTNSHESPSESKAVENSPNKVGSQLSEGKGSKLKESSKFLNMKNGDEKAKLNGAKPNENTNDKFNKRPKQQKISANIIKGKQINKENEEDEDLKLIKQIAGSRQKSQQESSYNKEREKSVAEDIREETGPSKLIEDQNGNGQQLERYKEQSNLIESSRNNMKNIKKLPVEKQKSFHEPQSAKGNPIKDKNQENQQTQMNEGQQGFMENGKNQYPPSKQINSAKSGQYITGKFVNFLTDVANHLNVDKLSIAEQLVKDVEESKAKHTNKASDIREANVVENENENQGNQLTTTELRKTSSRENPSFIRQKSNVVSPLNVLQIGRKQPEVIKYIWNKGISVLKEE